MRFLYSLLGVYWLVTFVLFAFFECDPDNVIIGVGFLITALTFIMFAIEYSNKSK